MITIRSAWPGIIALWLCCCGACLAADPQVEQFRRMGAYPPSLTPKSTDQPPASQPPAPATSAAPASPPDRLTHEFRMEQERIKLYEIAILSALALLSLFIVLRYITRKPGPKYSATDIVNATGLIFIIFGTILLVLMADTGEQLTAAIGILGAVAGYIFGAIKQKVSGSKGEAEPPDQTDN